MNIDNIYDAPLFSLKNYHVKGRVTGVYDGDSVTIIFPLFNNVYKWKCRLLGIDTPELRSRNELEKKRAYEIRDLLRKKVLNKIVEIECHEFDKYGRLLITFSCDNCNINQWLIDNDYAVKYEGGTKINWGDRLGKDNN